MATFLVCDGMFTLKGRAQGRGANAQRRQLTTDVDRLNAMKPFLKIAVVAGGYIAAFLMALAAVAIQMASTSGPAAQASSGMSAFGDAILFVAVFGLCSLVPTVAALFFLRSYFMQR